MDIDQLIKEGTFNRDYRVATIPVSLNPALAYALNQIAGIDDNDRILDPTCGTATVLIERQMINPALCVGVEINPNTVDLALRNLESYYHQKMSKELPKQLSVISGLWISEHNTTDESGVLIKPGNVTEQKFPEQFFTKIISNLPYGVHSGSRKENIQLYRFLADQAINWLRVGGKAVFLTQAKSILRNSFAFNPNWKLLEEISYPYQGLTLSIFVYERIE